MAVFQTDGLPWVRVFFGSGMMGHEANRILTRHKKRQESGHWNGRIGNSQAIEWTAHTTVATVQCVRVHHDGLDALVTEQPVHGANVLAVAEQVCGEAMARQLTRERERPFNC